MSGSFQAKIALGFSKLFKITQKSIYKEVAYSLCDFALTKQYPDGRFKTNEKEEDLTFLHPHLYSCEGLLYTGLELAEDRYIEAAMKGLEWALNQMDINNGSLPRSTKEKVEQSDCMAQLMRLLIVCYSELKKRNNSNIDDIIEKIQKSLASLFILDGEKGGGIKYQNSSNQICTWCTMFAIQAFSFYDKLKETYNLSMADMMEYYI
jgi:DNA polymerase III psi subunit